MDREWSRRRRAIVTKGQDMTHSSIAAAPANVLPGARSESLFTNFSSAKPLDLADSYMQVAKSGCVSSRVLGGSALCTQRVSTSVRNHAAVVSGERHPSGRRAPHFLPQTLELDQRGPLAQRPPNRERCR